MDSKGSRGGDTTEEQQQGWNPLLSAWSDPTSVLSGGDIWHFPYIGPKFRCWLKEQMAPIWDLQVFQVVLIRRHTKEPGRLMQRAASFEKDPEAGKD